MGKRDDFIRALRPILHHKEKLESYLTAHSNLPGPRGNLELAFAFAATCENFGILKDWLKIKEDRAGVNDPLSFLPFCSAVCLGKLYTKTKKPEMISLLKDSAGDGRWRMREAVAFGFQQIGEHDFSELQKIFSDWILQSGNLEKRAILVSLAHPPFLTEKNAGFCFEMTGIILEQMDRERDVDVLRKGLEFTISVFAAANPALGFRFITEWTGRDREIDQILKANLKKNRLVRKYPDEVNRLLRAL